jgi:hypothetical protein
MTRTKILALAATLAAGASLALAAAPASATAHPHATTVCGVNCDDVSGELLGPSFILNASSTGRNTVSPFAHRIVNLRNGSNQATNEDWDADRVGFLNDFCTRYPGGNGQIPATSYACVHLSQWAPVFEAEFTPNSVSSDFCAGAWSPKAGNKIRLFPCGTARTFFVEDISGIDPGEGPTGNYVPLVYAPDTHTTDPLVVAATEFTAHPAHQLVLQREQLTGADGAIAAQLVTEAPLLTGPVP